MDPQEPVLPDPDSPVQSPSDPVEDPPVMDEVESYEVSGAGPLS